MSQWVFPQSVSTEEGEWLHYKCTACHHMLHQILWLRCLSVLRASKTSVCVTVRHETQNWRSTNLIWGCDTPAHPQQPLVQTKTTDYMKGKASKWTRPMHWLRSERAGRARAGGFDMQANREEEEEKPSSDTKQQFDYWEWNWLYCKLSCAWFPNKNKKALQEIITRIITGAQTNRTVFTHLLKKTEPCGSGWGIYSRSKKRFQNITYWFIFNNQMHPNHNWLSTHNELELTLNLWSFKNMNQCYSLLNWGPVEITDRFWRPIQLLLTLINECGWVSAFCQLRSSSSFLSLVVVVEGLHWAVLNHLYV